MPANPCLAPILDVWAHQQRALVDTLRPLTDEQMGLSVPGAWPIWRLVGNIAGGRILWFHKMLGEPDLGHADLLELGGWDDDRARQRPAQELIEALENSWTVVETAVNSWDADDVGAAVQAIDWRGETVRLRRVEVVADIMSHDAHHGSEISLILRAHGLATLLNR